MRAGLAAHYRYLSALTVRAVEADSAGAILTIRMTAVAEIRALVVTRDGGVAATFAEVSKEFGIQADRSALNNGGVPPELVGAKFEAVCIDFETVSQTASILANVRESPANRNAVIFAVVGNAESRQRANDQGAMFLVERPLNDEAIRRVLHAAYGLMTRERRRYFRCATQVSIKLIRDSGEEILCNTINVSSNGIAVSGASAFETGEKLHIFLSLPDTEPPIRARGTVMWDDKHGKTGLSVECVSPKMQMDLDSWLDAQFQLATGKQV